MNAVIIGIIAFLYIVTSLWVGITGYVRTVEAEKPTYRERKRRDALAQWANEGPSEEEVQEIQAEGKYHRAGSRRPSKVLFSLWNTNRSSTPWRLTQFKRYGGRSSVTNHAAMTLAKAHATEQVRMSTEIKG